MMREMPLPVPINVSTWDTTSADFLRRASQDGLEERAGDCARGEPCERERGRDDSGRLRKASAIADEPVRTVAAGGVSKIGSSMVEVGDCMTDTSSFGSRETMPGAVGGLRLEFGGTGLRLIKFLFAVGVDIDGSGGLVRSDDIDVLSGGESGEERVFGSDEDFTDDVELTLHPPGRSFRAFSFTESG